MGKKSLDEIGRELKVTRQTLENWFKPFHNQEIVPTHVDCRQQVIVIDGYVSSKRTCVTLIVQLTNGKIVTWRFARTECFVSWLETLEQIQEFPFAVVGDGQKGMLKAIKQRWPGIIIQRCQFHVIHYVCNKLTQNPESEAAKQLRILTIVICNVKTIEDQRYWLAAFKAWYKEFESYIKEKTYHDSLTPTGRQKWSYTHSNLHASFSCVRNSLQYLFQYVKHPEIPNTSNFIEGSINASLQRKIDDHRGMPITHRQKLISVYLSYKQV